MSGLNKRRSVHVNTWNELLVNLGKELCREEVMTLKLLARDHIGNAKYEKIEKATDLFLILEKRGIISEVKVDYLKKIFTAANLHNVNTLLDDYESEHEKIKRRKISFIKRKDGSGNDDEFIGRQNEIDKITELLWGDRENPNNSSACVLITGLPGTGKTELATEVCTQQEVLPNAYVIELKGLNKSIDAFLKLYNEVVEPTNPIRVEEYSPSILESRVEEFCNICEKTILFDNADNIVAPDSSGSSKSQKEQFIEQLKGLVYMPKGRVKIIVTSRFKVFEGQPPKNFSEICLGSFTNQESISFLCSKYSTISDFNAERIASYCQNHPLALKIVSSRLQKGNTSPQEIIDSLEKYKMEVLSTGAEDSGIRNVLSLVFDQLEIEHQVLLASLTLFASSFNLNTAASVAAAVMSVDRQVAKIRIQDLLDSNLIEKVMRVVFNKLGVKMEDDKNERYTIHLLVKAFLQESRRHLISDEARKAFVECFGKELQSEARKSLRHNYAEGRFFLEKERANILEYVNLSKKLSIAPSVKHRKDQDRLLSLFTFMPNVLMYWKYRAEYFHSMAENAEKSVDWLSYCFFKAMEAEQYFSVNDFRSVASIIGKPFEIIEKLMKEKGSSGAKLVQAELYYVKGRLSAETEKFPKGCDLLQKSFDTRQAFYGTSTFTLRSLRALGYVYQSKGRQLDRALEYFKQSYQMAMEINENLVHPDFPVLLFDIGNCYLEKGFDLKNEKQAKEFFYQAATFFDRAIVSEKIMKIYAYTANTAKILRSKASAHLELGEHDPALEDARISLDIRRTKCGFDHRDTAASTFLVGYICYEKGVKLAKSKEDAKEVFEVALKHLKEAFRIEKNLGCDHHTDSYDRLKIILRQTLERLGRKKEAADYQREFEIAETLPPNTCSSESPLPEFESSPALEKMEVESNHSTSTSASEDESVMV